MQPLGRFISTMEYRPVDRVPHWELGVWPQTRERWEREGLDASAWHWNWFRGEEALGMDPREYVPFLGGLIPPFEQVVLEEDERTVTFRDGTGRIRRALKEGSIGGSRMSMDQYLRFDPTDPRRYAADWRERYLPRWRNRQVPLIFGPNCSTLGFYWFARELMGTENLSYAWYDQPALMHDMMQHHADFLIEAARPILEATSVEYLCLNEDMAMKNGPLISPELYRRYIFPRLKRVVDFFKSHGVRYVAIDTDGNPDPLISLMLDAGVDVLWPLERAADQDPMRIRRRYGRSLRLWGGVDKRVLTEGPTAIRKHLEALRPLVEEGGFIPTVDHTVPPDVSWSNFQYYLEIKRRILEGRSPQA